MQKSEARRSSWRLWARRGLLATLGLLVVAFVVVSWTIGTDVRAARDAALEAYSGDQVEALLAFVETPTYGLQKRNRAVWALGQLGDPRALPVLEKYFTGGTCNHERALCQRELGKALEMCRGGVNLTALVWRHGSLRPGHRDTSARLEGNVGHLR